QLRMKYGWKTYWRNPGDSGVPPMFDWSGSQNLKDAEILYPVPHRFSDANGTAIGYKNEVVFPIRIVPEDAGKPVLLALTMDYGLCKDMCIPVSVDLKASIPPDLGTGHGPLIEKAKALVPKPATTGALPRLEAVTFGKEGTEPALEIDAVFAPHATNTDLFVNSTEVLLPVPSSNGAPTEGKQRFSIVFATPDEAADVKGKPLTFTLISDQGASETVHTVPE
ncbi:MAG: protein-disulfide reductase DsbD domain-containing protein, partial [Pseudomonadota bacterium]